jgi:hypothetical protein
MRSQILSIDPYTKEFTSNINNTLKTEQNPQYVKNQYLVSYISTQNFITTYIKLNKNIEDEDIFDAISIQIYDEIALDQAVEYLFQYIEIFNELDPLKRVFQVFIIDPKIVKNSFSSTIKKINYINLITPLSLLFKSLYTKKIIDSDNTHCFIYISYNDAFIAIYKNQEFLYTKSINYSLTQIHQQFSQLYGKKISYELFLELINYEDGKKIIDSIYQEMFSNINTILTYTRKSINIEKIDQLYIGIDIKSQSNLFELAQQTLDIKSSDFNFEYGFNISDNTTHLNALLHLLDPDLKDNRYSLNFSIFHKPKRFIKRESGKLITLTILSLFIAFLYPLSFIFLKYTQDIQYKLLDKEYQELHTQKLNRQAQIKSKKELKQELLSTLKNQEKQYNEKKNTLIKIHETKVNYPMKAKIIAIFSIEFNKYDVKLKTIEYKQLNGDKIFIFELISKSDKQITNLIKDLTKAHAKSYSFSLEQILFDEKSKLYSSILRVKVL